VSYIDLAIHLIRRFGGGQLALRCARMLVFDSGRSRQSPYFAFEPEKAHGDKLIHKAQEWLETNYWREIDVETVASLLNMSSRNFKRRFKASCGEPMTHYLQHVRLAAACDRLAVSDAPIQQIIYDVGYADVSSFGRLFKESTGLTMGEYRKRFWSRRGSCGFPQASPF
jgi:transcriptional regulator GlxA family with amidase domain